MVRLIHSIKIHVYIVSNNISSIGEHDLNICECMEHNYALKIELVSDCLA